MPELAAIYLVGAVFNLFLMGVHLFLQNRKNSSKKMQLLQINLGTQSLAWSDRRGQVITKSDFDPIEEWSRQKRTILVSGLFCTLISWPGFVFQFVLMLSIRYLARPRLEKRLWESELAEKEMSPEQVAQRLNQMQITRYAGQEA